MTSQEKAKDIVVKLMELTPDYIIKENNVAFELCKLHALIVVDEILKGIVPKDDDERYAFELRGNKYYWQEIKQEIEKL